MRTITAHTTSHANTRASGHATTPMSASTAASRADVQPGTRAPAAAICAYTAALLFAAHLATYFVPSLRDATLANAVTLAGSLALLALAQHVVVFPVVAALPAAGWARLAGYTWLVADMGTDLLQLGGAPKSLYLTLRLGVNLLAALWIVSASLRARGGMRALGVFVAADFACYSFAAALSPLAFVVALPSLVLLPLWFALAGRRIQRCGRVALA